MNLEHVVVTSVARDDLPDGGAHIFAQTIRAIREHAPRTGVEVLIPDFNGQDEPLRTVMEAAPDILNHNVETVERLQKPVRKRARYHRSLEVLQRAKEFAHRIHRSRRHRAHQVEPDGRAGRDARGAHQTFVDLRAVDCDVLTIGQYLRPSEQQLPLGSVLFARGI